MQLTMPDKHKPGARFSPVGALAALAVLVLAGLGLYLWYSAGRMTFKAESGALSMAVLSPGSGRLAFVDVQQGQSVYQSQILARLDDGGLLGRVEEQRRLVFELALTLPPEAVMLPSPGGGQESLTQQEERRRLTEEEAAASLQAATEAEAEAAILFQRASLLAAKGSLEPAQRDAAEQALAAARRAAAEARAEFERLSLKRASSSADIRRLKELQYLSGAAQVPVGQRLSAYKRASEALALSESELAAFVISAPADGIIASIAVQAGQALGAGDMVMELTPYQAVLGYKALLPLDQAEKLRAGQACRITRAGQKQTLPGVVRSVQPLPGNAESEVWIAPLERTPEAAPGSIVEVTVLLRQEASESGLLLPARPSPGAGAALDHNRPSTRTGAGAGAAFDHNRPSTGTGGARMAGTRPSGAEPVPAEPSAAAPPAAPLSVQTPFGDDEDPLTRQEQSTPPLVKAGSPAALGQVPGKTPADTPDTARRLAPPALPPMVAPKKLTGSPLPSRDNNPSIVRPRDLEAADSRP